MIPIVYQILGIIAEATIRDGFIAEWEIAACLGVTPAHKGVISLKPFAEQPILCLDPLYGGALNELEDKGLIEEFPGFDYRWRLVFQEKRGS